jgi:hypothetical protein
LLAELCVESVDVSQGLNEKEDDVRCDKDGDWFDELFPFADGVFFRQHTRRKAEQSPAIGVQFDCGTRNLMKFKSAQ